MEVCSHLLSVLAVLAKESGAMSVALNVGFAALVATRGNKGGGVFPGALRKRRILRDVIVVSRIWCLIS